MERDNIGTFERLKHVSFWPELEFDTDIDPYKICEFLNNPDNSERLSLEFKLYYSNDGVKNESIMIEERLNCNIKPSYYYPAENRSVL